MTKDLSRLLRPKSIAVLGGAWAQNVVQQCQLMGFEGEIWPIHPTKTEVHGLKCYRGLPELPSAPDATFIGVNRNLTIQTVQTLQDMGAGGAVCFAAGFDEAGEAGGDLQNQLLDVAGDMPIIGPNCYGLISYLDGALLWPDQHGGKRVDTGVAIITQSSNIAINMSMQKRGLPIAYLGTAGNQAQLGLADLGMAFLEDPRVTALGLHIEGFGDIRAFERLALRADQLGKKIIAIKVGRSEQARAATVSHTASLAGEDTGAQALLDRLGIRRLGSIAAFMETLKLLHLNGPLARGHIASISCSGGEASLIADSALDFPRVSFPELSKKVAAELSQQLGPLVKISNPLDYHTFIWNDLAAMTGVFTSVLKTDIDLGCFIFDVPRSDRCSDEDWDLAVQAIAAAQKATGTPTAILASLPENLSEKWCQKCIDLGLIPMCGLDETLAAISAVSAMPLPTQAPALLPQPTSTEIRLVDEETAKSELSNFGVPIPTKIRVPSAEKAAIFADTLVYPLVLKGLGIAHKTEMGAVKLNLKSAQEVLDAAAGMVGNGYLIEQFIDDVIVELLVGVVLDPAHGYVLTIGAGGTLTEILKDSKSLILPVSKIDVESALSSLKIAPLIDGYRGKAAADKTAIIDAILAVAAYVAAHQGQIQEVEINPLLCREHDAFAADVLLRRSS